MKDDRFVGMFYFMTHTTHGGNGPDDVTKIMKADPENPKWGEGSHWWGEPEIGYYLNNDEWAIRRHAYQLADAGVDVLIFDVTNSVTYPEVYLNICRVFHKMRAEGERTPDITFLGSGKSLDQLWKDFYSKGLYPDLWFYWKGKPLILFGQAIHQGRMRDVIIPENIKEFFNIRESWAWTSLDWYKDGKDQWPWVDHYPQAIGWHDSPDEKEMVPVAVAQHPLSNIGRSFHNFFQPAADKYDLTPFTSSGLCFEEQWKRALEVKPEFVFVTGWNEWSAGKVTMKRDISKELKFWDFYPGAHLGKAGRPLNIGDTYFIDQYNQEFSRDIEPMKDGHTDNYYYQLMANVRKYKGVSKPADAAAEMTINIKGPFSQWDKAGSVYYDHLGDTEHRNCQGEGQAGPYINNTGRNDIVKLKVAHDAEYIYFYAETREPLTTCRDHNWMQLFIDTDRNKKTGWEGYDFIVNNSVQDSCTTTIAKLNDDGSVSQSVKVALRYNSNKLMLAVPRAFTGMTGKLNFEFHWADNIARIGDISEFFLGGDSAPDRRANYCYSGL